MDYEGFLKGKTRTDHPSGLRDLPPLNPMLFDFQRDIVAWALRRGRAAIFADCGLGKTPMQLEWARHVPGDVLIVAPLAVSRQTIREGMKFGVEVDQSQDGTKAGKITITNYERLHHFDPAEFAGVVLDESSILKSHTGKYRTELIENWGAVPFRLAATATPAPNDYMELGEHCQFLGAMRSTEMLSRFFINDPGSVGKYRVKGHAKSAFFNWMADWAVMMRRPSDLGYEDRDFVLPSLNVHNHVIDANAAPEGMLFAVDAHTMLERKRARKATAQQRAEAVAKMVNGSDEHWLVWCDLNSESEMLSTMIDGAVEVKGADSPEHKESALLGFAESEFRVLVSKPKIAGWGMNYHHCHNVAFTGLSDSFEQYYQAVRRCWRFGQKKEVECHIVTDRTEGAVVANIRRKERDAEALAVGMCEAMASRSRAIVHGDVEFKTKYSATEGLQVPSWLK